MLVFNREFSLSAKWSRADGGGEGGRRSVCKIGCRPLYGLKTAECMASAVALQQCSCDRFCIFYERIPCSADTVTRMLPDWQNIYIVASIRHVIINLRYLGLQFSAQAPGKKHIVLRLRLCTLMDSLLLGLYYKWTLLLFFF